jgi:hypothetical protein
VVWSGVVGSGEVGGVDWGGYERRGAEMDRTGMHLLVEDFAPRAHAHRSRCQICEDVVLVFAIAFLFFFLP